MQIKVSDVLRDMLVSGPCRPESGICPQVFSQALKLGVSVQRANEIRRDFKAYVREASTTWPEFSGHISYPVAAPRSAHGPTKADKAYWSKPKWAKSSYGNARRRLLRHLIIFFRDRGM